VGYNTTQGSQHVLWAQLCKLHSLLRALAAQMLGLHSLQLQASALKVFNQ
jgi:hypothetical protein